MHGLSHSSVEGGSDAEHNLRQAYTHLIYRVIPYDSDDATLLRMYTIISYCFAMQTLKVSFVVQICRLPGNSKYMSADLWLVGNKQGVQLVSENLLTDAPC